LHPAGLGVLVTDEQTGLAAMRDRAGRGLQQQGSAGDRLTVLLGLGQAREDAPPVVDQRGHARHEPAALEIWGAVKAPQPQWFLSSSKAFAQSARSRYSAAMGRISAILDGEILGRAPAQHHEAARTAPAARAQRGLYPLSAQAGIAPLGLAQQAFDELLGALG